MLAVREGLVLLGLLGGLRLHDGIGAVEDDDALGASVVGHLADEDSGDTVDHGVGVGSKMSVVVHSVGMMSGRRRSMGCEVEQAMMLNGRRGQTVADVGRAKKSDG